MGMPNGMNKTYGAAIQIGNKAAPLGMRGIKLPGKRGLEDLFRQGGFVKIKISRPKAAPFGLVVGVQGADDQGHRAILAEVGP
jgi:hypothetical protein